MIQRGLTLGAILLACLSLGPVCSAADTDIKEVVERLKALEQKNRELETKLKQAESRPSSTAAIDKAMLAADDRIGSVITAPDIKCRPLKIGGYIDMSYQYNFNRPDNQNNNLRVYDRDSNGSNLHYAELNFERLPTCPGEAGFRIDIGTGTDAPFQASIDNSGLPTDRLFDLQQAYISYIAPVGNGITVDAGKFVTWAGAEVIEASDNINSSRSLLFGFAIPSTHTGLRATYSVFKDKWTLGAGVVNGWDNIQDQNDSKTAMLMSNWTPVSWFNWVIVGMYGSEQAVNENARLAAALAGPTLLNEDGGEFAGSDLDDATIPGISSTVTGKRWDGSDKGGRILVDTTLTFTPWEKFTFAINGDIGAENDVPQANGPRNRTWWGVAGYLKYQFAENWYVANRTEYFSDRHGARTGTRQRLWETTLTIDWKISEPMHVRFEARHDDSNRDVYSDRRGMSNAFEFGNKVFHDDSQDTFMVSWLYKF